MSTEIETKLKSAIAGNQLNADVLQESIFENSEYSAIILGGDAETHVPVVTKDFGEIEKIITGNSLFSAKFYVTWRERKFVDGIENFTDRGWEKNGDKLTAHFSTVIPLPANATDIHVKATENTGLAWEGWRTVVDENVPLTSEVKVSIWGTTLSEKGKVEVIA